MKYLFCQKKHLSTQVFHWINFFACCLVMDTLLSITGVRNAYGECFEASKSRCYPRLSLFCFSFHEDEPWSGVYWMQPGCLPQKHLPERSPILHQGQLAERCTISVTGGYHFQLIFSPSIMSLPSSPGTGASRIYHSLRSCRRTRGPLGRGVPGQYVLGTSPAAQSQAQVRLGSRGPASEDAL